MNVGVRRALLVTGTCNVRLYKALGNSFRHLVSRQAPLSVLVINRTVFFRVILGIEQRQVICFRPKKWVIVIP